MAEVSPRRSKRRLRQTLLGAAVILVVVLGWGHGRLPPLEPRSPTETVADLASTDIARALAPVSANHGDRSGIVAIEQGQDALAVRLMLADAARRTLDVRYYIWHDDVSGTLLLDALCRAADRGVRVRLLIDDGGTTGMDDALAAIDTHPNIEVRLFNPFAQRHLRWLAYLTDFRRLNRRMHNKSFTADGTATIVGGRNVGDVFGRADDVNFLDLDVLVVGPAVTEVASDFDRYWSSRSAYPAERLLGTPDAKRLERVRVAAQRRSDEPLAKDYGGALERSKPVRSLLQGKLEFEWTRVQLVSDDPGKVLGRGPVADSLPDAFKELLGSPKTELQIVSSYFVPTDEGVDSLAKLAGRGAKVSVLTNSLATTDVVAVHGGYAKYREPLLRSGVTVRELRAGDEPRNARNLLFVGSRSGGAGAGASLHAKTYAVDRKRLYVGSLNFDPRSVRLNTEMGFLIDSPAMASRVSDFFNAGLRERAWTLKLDGNGELRWVDPRDGTTVDHEPDASPFLRFVASALSWIPADGLL